MTNRCVGLLGRIFGHKFHQSTWDSDRIYYTDVCQRCGRKADA